MSAPVILIVKLSALGDVVHALPALDGLRRAVPEARIDWAVDARFAALLEGHPGLRRVVPLDIRRWKGSWAAGPERRQVLAAVRDLRSARYDIALDLQGNVKSGVVALLSGAPLRYGFDRRGVREWPNLLFTNRKVPLRPADIHITEKLLRVAGAPFGGAIDPASLQPAIATAAADEAAAARALAEILPGASPRLAVHPGSTWTTKKMDPSFWADAVRLLRGTFPGLGVALSWGSGEERTEAGEVARRAGGATALLPPLSLKELAALYRACGFVMGPDTGPLHVAWAAGARTVSVFRATDGRRNAPRGPGHRFLQAPLPCTACLRKACDRDAACRASLSPAAAADAMAALMRDGAGRP